MTSTHFAAIYFANPEKSKELQESFQVLGIDSQIARNSEDLYNLLNYRPVDFVILENELRGFLSGIDILAKVYQDLLRPTTILLARPTTEVRQKAFDLGIDLVLPPDCPLVQVRDAVGRLMSEEKVTQVLIPPGARRLVQSHDDIQPLPQVMLKLASHLSSAEIEIKDLAEDISTDAKSAADLLKLANSSAVGLQRKVSNVMDAIKYLGNRRTISLLLSHGVLNTQRSLGNSTPPSERMWYNYRSVLIANTAALFAERFEEISPPTAHVLGLLQDLGILVMIYGHENRYLQILRRFRTIGQLRLEVMEQQEFGYNHAHVSAAVLQKWGLPTSMITLVLGHHDPVGTNQRSRTEERFMHVMGLGEAFANLSDGHVPQRYPLLQKRLLDYGDANSDTVRTTLAEAVSKVVESKEIFSMPIPDNQAMQQLAAQLESNDYVAVETREEAQAESKTQSIAPKPVRPSVPVSDRSRVLVVDDEPPVLALLERMLNAADLEAVTSETAESAYELAEGAVAVLIDVHLPGESGIQFTKELRRRGYTGPIIVVSGDRTRATVGECLIAGATDYLAKPVSESVLYAKLRKHTGLSLAVTTA